VRGCTTNSRRTAEEQQQHAAAPAAAEADAIVNALIAGGIGEPKLSHLAERCRAEGVTPSAIRHEIEQARERGKGTGALILNIGALCDRAGQAVRDAAAKREHANASDDAAAVELQHLLDGLPGEERDEIAADAEKGLTAAHRHDLDSDDDDRREAANRQLTTNALLIARQRAARRTVGKRPPPPRPPARADALAVSTTAT
jgi:hypothetical protein